MLSEIRYKVVVLITAGMLPLVLVGHVGLVLTPPEFLVGHGSFPVVDIYI